MKYPFLTAVCLISLASALTSCNDNDKEHLILKYDKPAEYFEESLVIGNGNLGAIIYGGAQENIIALNDITLWSGEPIEEPFTPDAYKHLDQVRKYLDLENYRMADASERMIQGRNSQYYQPLGTLTIHSDVSYANTYERILDISEAVARDHFFSIKGSFEREYFASAPDSVIVIRIKASKGEQVTGAITYDTPQQHETTVSTDGKKGIISTTGYTAYGFDRKKNASRPDYFLFDPEKGIHFRTLIETQTKGGKVTVAGDTIFLEKCREATILITNVTSFNGADKDPVKEGREYINAAQARIDAASAKKYKELRKNHVNDYSEMFNRVSIDFGTTDPETAMLPTDLQLKNYGELNQSNPDLEELYFQFGRYLLISCSRTPEVPANLQGLWNESTTAPWRSNYTMNINLEENYWPSETGNLPELNNSLISFIKRLSEGGVTTARNYYGVQEGWCSGHNSDIWAQTEPVGEQRDSPQWAGWPMGAAWLTTHLWEHYAFSMDKDFLAEAYPVLKGAAEFCMGWLVEKNGWLMTSPATSPEANYITESGYSGSTLYGGSADLAFTRECLIDAQKAAQVLGCDEDFITRVDSTLAHILPYKIGSRGNLQEWYFDWEDQDWQHRHQSHLFGLFPGHHISVEKTPELAEACARSLEIKGDRSTGWSTGWRVNLQARLRNAEKAYHIYRMLLSYISPDKYDGDDAKRGGGTYPNLLDAHSPFQIDGNFGGCAGVMEMLVQSDIEDGAILLPALPDAWKAKGSLKGVRIRGGYELSFSWIDGHISALSVKSNRKDDSVLKVKEEEKEWIIPVSAGETRKVEI